MHGGHVLKDDDPQTGVENWRRCSSGWSVRSRVHREHGRRGLCDGAELDRIARLWEAVDGFDVGVLPRHLSCHFGRRGPLDIVDRVKAITGRIDLVHCNNSRDTFGSGADRHANLGSGQIDPGLILEVVRAAGAPVVVETPATVRPTTSPTFASTSDPPQRLRTAERVSSIPTAVGLNQETGQSSRWFTVAAASGRP